MTKTAVHDAFNGILVKVNTASEKWALAKLIFGTFPDTHISCSFGDSVDKIDMDYDLISIRLTDSRLRVDGNHANTLSKPEINFSQFITRFAKAMQELPPIVVPLNDEHSATFKTKGHFHVGCQTFPCSVIDALVKARDEMEKRGLTRGQA